MIVRGDRLPLETRQEILRRYPYRWTSDNPRRAQAYGTCPHCKTPGGLPEPTLRDESRMACRKVHPVVSLTTDAQWLKEHAFHVTETGRLDARSYHAEPAFMADEIETLPWEKKR